MAGSGPKVYDFMSEDNSPKWKGLLQPALRKIQKQVHPRLDIEDDAVNYLENLIYRLLAQMCATQPHTQEDVETYVQRNFASPIDAWALSDAKVLMERSQRRKGVFHFPIDKMFPILQKDLFGYKIDLQPVQFIMAILDYVSADILKLGGQFAKNTRKPALVINQYDIRVSMAADPALQVLFQPLQGGHKAEMMMPRFEDEPSEPRTLSYDDHLRELIDEERKYVRHLNLIMKVFMEPFMNKNVFSQQDVDTIFGEIGDLHELSVQLVGSLEECIEMAGEMQGARCPQAGFVFEELAESFEFDVYLRYAENYMEALAHLDNLMEDEDVVKHFTSQPTKLFKEAMHYILPKSLLEPIYHCFYYFEVLDALEKMSKTNDDRDALNSSIACMLGLKSAMERECSRFLTSKREESGIYSKRLGYQITMKKVAQLQEKIEGWEGIDITACCTELIMEGALGVTRENKRSAKTDRHVFLLDGLTVCCRTKAKGGAKERQYRLKEKINMRKVTLVDLQDSDDLKFAFQLVEPDQPAYIFFAISKSEKREWMSALTQLLTKSTFDRLLDAKLREEEKTIPILRPDSNKYKFADGDSAETIMFDEPEGEKSITGPGPLIKAGTIHKLVERLTYHEYADPNLVRTFLMTYRSFCQPNELLDLLVERYKIPNPDGMEDKKDPISMKAMKNFKTTYVTPIQLRVLNVLRHWVEFHYYDFERDSKLLEKLERFVGSVTSRNMQKWVTSIHRALKKKKDEGGSSVTKSVVFNKDPDPVEWHIAKTREEYNLLTLHPLEIARQLTLILSEYFRAIHPSELVDASWMKEQKKEKASPNLLKLSRFETKMSNWLSMEIVFTENFEERVALVSRLVDIMVALKEQNNFSGMFIINAAFESASVFRLKHTFMKALTQRRQQVLDDMKQIASSDNNFKNYRDRLRNINPPCVPFVGMYLSWIVFIRDGQENTIPGKPDHFINFRKRRKIADVLQEIQQYQNSPYCIHPEASIQEYIKSQDPVGEMTPNQWEDHVFEMSRSIEPKDAQPRRVPRKYKFDLRPPDSSKGGILSGTLMGRGRNKQHAPTNTTSEGPQDGEENSPGPGSAPSSPSPFVVEGGSINGTHSMDKRKGSLPGGTSTPPRPPKPSKTSSFTELPCQPSLPLSSPMVNSAVMVPSRPPKVGYGKPPPPPPPDNDAPPLPPRSHDETPPLVNCSSPANVIPLPPREYQPPPPLPMRRWKESPPPPLPPKGLQGQC